MSDARLRIGFVGAGRVGDVHYEGLQSCADLAELAAFCDVRPEAVSARGQEWGVPGFTSVEAMLDAVPLDGLGVLLPHDVHLEVMRTCLARKLPILLEKPIASRPDEAAEIVRLVNQAGVPVLVGHNGLFHPAMDKVVRFVKEGWIGKPILGSANSLQWMDFRPWDFRKSLEKTGGGAWIDCASHLVYRLGAVLGKVEAVAGFTGHIARPEMEGEDSVAAVVRYPSGVIAQILISYGCKQPGYEKDWPSGCEQMVMVSGDEGMVQYHICPSPRLRFYTERSGSEIARAGEWTEVPVEEPFEVSFHVQMRHFLECVRGESNPKVTAADAADLLTTLLKLYEAQAD